MGTPRAVQKKQQAQFAAGEVKAAAIGHDDRQYSQGGKEETVKHHVLDAHLVERQPAPVEACTPEAAGQRAGTVAQQCGLPSRFQWLCHSLFTFAYWEGSWRRARTWDSAGVNGFADCGMIYWFPIQRQRSKARARKQRHGMNNAVAPSLWDSGMNLWIPFPHAEARG